MNTKLRDVDGSSVTRLALNHLSSNLKINKEIQSQAMAVHNATTKPSLALQVSTQGAPFTNTGILRPIAEEMMLSSPLGK